MAAAARQIRRLFGPIGGAVRGDVLAATEMDANSSDEDLAAWATCRKSEASMVGNDGLRRTKEQVDRVEGDS